MTRASLRVLAYHRIAEPGESPAGAPSLISASPAGFERQVEHLVTRYRVVSLEQVLEAQRGGPRLPPGAVLLTFDDAYEDFAEYAWPILRRHGLSATVFVPTGYPDNPGAMLWWERLHQAFLQADTPSVVVPGLGPLAVDTEPARRASLTALQDHLKRLPHSAAMAVIEGVCQGVRPGAVRAPGVLGWSELRRLAGEGVALAAHTRTHPALTQLPIEDVRAEIRGSLDDLALHAGSAHPVFCCPFGLFDDRVIQELRRQGVALAFTCVDGHNRIPAGDPLRLRRTSITPRTTTRIFTLRLLKAGAYLDRWRHRPRQPRPRPTRPAPGPAVDGPRRSAAGMKIAYIMSRFPKLSETFILNEILAVEAAGVPVEIYPLLRERQPVAHPEALRLTERARFHPFLSTAILRAQAHYLRRAPRTYFQALFQVLRETLGSANFFIGAIGIFPKSVRFAYEMERTGVTHVHAHFCSHPAVAALIIHRLTGIPYSFTAHGSDLHVERRMLGTKLEAAAFAVTVCGFNKEVMVQECGESLGDRVHVIHCGVDTTHFRRPSRPRDPAPVQIVSVASLEAVKGHRYLVEACRILAARGIDFRCHLVGEGPLRGSIEAGIEKAGLAGQVLLHGGQPRAEVARFLARADVAVLASHPTAEGRREGLPVALMEAMASGLPVVASSISGIPELVDHDVAGLLVPSGDPMALADALERLARDPELRRRMGERGREKVLREFSLDANVRELLRLIRDSGVARAPARAADAAAPPVFAGSAQP